MEYNDVKTTVFLGSSLTRYQLVNIPGKILKNKFIEDMTMMTFCSSFLNSKNEIDLLKIINAKAIIAVVAN